MAGVCQWDLSNMGRICQIWAPIYYGTVMKYVANNFRMVFFWSLSVLSIWAGHLPIFDKSKWQTSTEYFSRGDPLPILKWWNRALWLAEKRSQGQFPRLSLVESTACDFPDPPRSRGVYHIWVGFVKSGILPIYEKPWWKIPYNNYSRPFHHGTSVYRGPYSTKPGICHIWGGLSYMGGVCQIWAPIYYGTVKVYVANLGVCHQGLSYMGSISDLTNPTHKWQTPLILSG